MEINGLKFEQLTSACPEQYDVKDQFDRMVGYVRLRFGKLRCDFPNIGGETIYYISFDDEMKGCFDDDKERNYHLNEIAKRILEKISISTSSSICYL